MAKRMRTIIPLRCTVATSGVEVVTLLRADGVYVTELHGGRLDGDTFTCESDPDEQHEKACRVARMAEWRGARKTQR